jgi:DNA (cytosine-5)-methyltransferase 1
VIADLFDAIDLFAGPGGWSEGMRQLGLRDLGLEHDDAACRTRYAAGHATWQVDVTTVDPAMFNGVRGLIASPPCPDWSSAGKRAGRAGTSGHLVDVVPRWVESLVPEWVVCEQVPDALEVWHEHAELYRRFGYSTWCGILNAANYGVPQARHRAFLIACRDRVAAPPEPTHAEHPEPSFFGELEPWVTAGTVIGNVWVDTRCDLRPDGSTQTFWAPNRPATTITGKSMSQWIISPDDRPFTLLTEHALELQSFPSSYPVQGNRTQIGQQIGNAVPPTVAARIVAAVTGRRMELAA